MGKPPKSRTKSTGSFSHFHGLAGEAFTISCREGLGEAVVEPARVFEEKSTSFLSSLNSSINVKTANGLIG